MALKPRGQLLGLFGHAVGEHDFGPAVDQAVGNRLTHAPGPEHQRALALQRTRRLAAPAHGLLQAVHGRLIVGIVAPPLVAVEDDGVGGPDAFDRVVLPGQFRQDGFFVRDGDAEALDSQFGGLVDEAGKVLARHADRNVNLVEV